uniref:Uncharacterized protein n=1 Tax=Chlorocebus sabaeus TaxID=60711 RepID=A0A0D9S3Z2_CHLSB
RKNGQQQLRGGPSSAWPPAQPPECGAAQRVALLTGDPVSAA